MDNKSTIPPNTFPKAEKLKSRKAIDELFKSGKSFFIHPYKVFFQVVDAEKSIANGQLSVVIGEKNDAFNSALGIRHSQIIAIQAGFAVSTKNFKHAVDRNRIKRLGREAYRLNKHALISHVANQHLQLLVFFVFTNKSLPTFAQVQQAMQACLRKLIKNV